MAIISQRNSIFGTRSAARMRSFNNNFRRRKGFRDAELDSRQGAQTAMTCMFSSGRNERLNSLTFAARAVRNAIMKFEVDCEESAAKF